MLVRLIQRRKNLLSLQFRRDFASISKHKMGKKNKSSVPAEQHLLLPSHSTTASIVDTHTHLASTFAAYRGKYPQATFENVFDFVRGMYRGRKVEAIVDVWCEAPVQSGLWKEFADSALTKEDRDTKWGGLEYWFVMGELILRLLPVKRLQCASGVHPCVYLLFRTTIA